MPTVNLELKDKKYPIIIGNDIGSQISKLVKKETNGKLFIFFDAQVYALHGVALLKKLKRSKLKIIECVIKNGEQVKNKKELDKIHDFLLANDVNRSDFILAVGGGVISDLVGFASSTILRGLKWGVVSTTLLSMVDASIGGKTGINHKSGKNLIGIFWHPSFVICDISYLSTLPERELIAGIGEVTKYAGLTGEPFLSYLENYLQGKSLLVKSKLIEIVRFSATFKSFIVSIDEREQNERMYLNFGHTFAHAIENSLGYGKLLHGEAVILGLFGALELSFQLGSKVTKEMILYQAVIKNLMRSIPFKSLSADKIYNAMSLDKKRTSKDLRFIIIEKPGKPVIASGLKKEYIKKAIVNMLENYKMNVKRR